MNALHSAIETILPYMISILEIIGIFVVFWSGIHGFWQYFQNTFMRKKFDLQTNLAKGLAMGLEFKMAAEILKTVLIQSLDELYVLGAVILLRALLSVLIHFELHPRRRAHQSAADSAEKKHLEDDKN
jgi:uncharacterized membrane protein